MGALFSRTKGGMRASGCVIRAGASVVVLGNPMAMGQGAAPTAQATRIANEALTGYHPEHGPWETG